MKKFVDYFKKNWKLYLILVILNIIPTLSIIGTFILHPEYGIWKVIGVGYVIGLVINVLVLFATAVYDSITKFFR